MMKVLSKDFTTENYFGMLQSETSINDCLGPSKVLSTNEFVVLKK